MKVEVQRRVLDAFAKLSGPDKRPVTSEDVGQTIRDVSTHTLALSNAFFVDVGWLDKQKRGTYAATDALINYRRRAAMNPDDLRAREALRDTMMESWFWQAIKNHIEFGGDHEEEVLQVLMHRAEASPEHAKQLRHLLEWVEWTGLIRREDGRVLLPEDEGDAAPRAPEAASNTPAAVEEELRPPLTVNPPDEKPAPAPHQSAGTAQRSPSVISFSFAFDMSADDLAKLSPEQIQTLFAAVGNVMSIRAQVTQ
jgi:hypothetical protein